MLIYRLVMRFKPWPLLIVEMVATMPAPRFGSTINNILTALRFYGDTYRIKLACYQNQSTLKTYPW